MVLTSCKEKNENVVGTNDNGEKLVLNDNGDTVTLVENDSVKTTVATPVADDSALKKNDDGSYSFQIGRAHV